MATTTSTKCRSENLARDALAFSTLTDMDAKALVNHEPIDLTMETLGFQNKNKNQVLACVLTWKLEKEESYSD